MKKIVINYIRDYTEKLGEGFVGYPLEFQSVVAQCNSTDFKELKKEMKILLKSWLKFNLKILEQKEPFKYIEFKDSKKWIDNK